MLRKRQPFKVPSGFSKEITSLIFSILLCVISLILSGLILLHFGDCQRWSACCMNTIATITSPSTSICVGSHVAIRKFYSYFSPLSFCILNSGRTLKLLVVISQLFGISVPLLGVECYWEICNFWKSLESFLMEIVSLDSFIGSSHTLKCKIQNEYLVSHIMLVENKFIYQY